MNREYLRSLLKG